MPYTKFDWVRDLKAAAHAAGIEQQKELAVAIGFDPVTVNRWWLGKTMPQTGPKRRDVLARIAAHRQPPGAASPPLSLVPVSPRFTTEAERTAHVAGILTMANLNNDQVKACVQAALDALLAPLSGPTRPTDDEAPPSLRAAARETGTRLHPPAKRAR